MTTSPQPSVLLIDDEADFRNVVAWRLQREGSFKVMMAENGQAGLLMAKQQHPDVVVTDFTMPDMTGHQVLKQLRGLPATADIPVILLTSHGGNDQINESLKLGAVCHVEKWSDGQVLLEEIKLAIARHRTAHPQ